MIGYELKAIWEMSANTSRIRPRSCGRKSDMGKVYRMVALQAVYQSSWKGIDAGREGLWREPLWSSVLEIVGNHLGENVYKPTSSIYTELTAAFPNEKWCSLTPERGFRPLFRDYPHPWTRPGLLDLSDQKFRLTSSGLSFLEGAITKKTIFIKMFSKHTEDDCNPFAILAHIFLNWEQPLSAGELFWGVMKNYRPPKDNLEQSIKRGRDISLPPPQTPNRRLKHMLQLMRSVEAIESYRSANETKWAARDRDCLLDILTAHQKALDNG
jgi:hypothetical protein